MMTTKVGKFLIRLVFFGILLATISLGIQCSGIPNEPPRFQYPGFRTKCIFLENFDSVSDPQWQLEGAGTAEILEDSSLIVRPATDSLGIIVWTDQEFKGYYQLEYQLYLPDTMGLHILFVAATGLNGENIFEMERAQPGAYETYTDGQLKNYQLSMHSYDLQGKHHDHSRLRKNPGNLLLSHIPEDPCEAHRWYTIDFIKTGNRLRLYVDGKAFHDFRDKGDRKNQYDRGRIGFWFNGIADRFSARLKNIRVYKLIPD